MTIRERIAALQAKMKDYAVDAYVVPTSDYHESEYVGDYFKARAYLSGFTGSAGVLGVTTDKAGLWTDGRYFNAAAKQLEDTGITLMKMGEEGVPTIEEFLAAEIPQGGKLGFDGKVVNTALAESWKEKLSSKEITLSVDKDLAGMVWDDRPAISKAPTFRHELKYCGRSTADKLSDLRAQMKSLDADAHILTTLDDIAWLFNIRGGDVLHSPVVLSYALITADEARFYLHEEVLSNEVKAELESEGVTVRPYTAIYEEVKDLSNQTVLLDANKVNYCVTENLPEDATLINAANPTTLAKSMKNETEVENTIRAHLYDGVAFTKFMYWLKNNYDKQTITEISAADYLANLRYEQPENLGLSFNTIAGFGANAAMMHYSATPETDTAVTAPGMLLVDSGGQYYSGTTDITRTMVFGELEEETKKHFTAVVRSCIRLGKAKFLYGCRGLNLDILSRGPIWEMGIDYKCGTGHGVGHLLNVHEGPNGFRWRIVPERNDSAVLEEGMITTDEPGIYLEGKYGIRIENELVCRKGEKNEYGQFMYFDIITVAPIDLDGIDPKYMMQDEIDALNAYHASVYEKLSPFMTEEENEWLKVYTRPISK